MVDQGCVCLFGRRSKSHGTGRRLSLWAIGCTPALSVTYSAAVVAAWALYKGYAFYFYFLLID